MQIEDLEAKLAALNAQIRALKEKRLQPLYRKKAELQAHLREAKRKKRLATDWSAEHRKMRDREIEAFKMRREGLTYAEIGRRLPSRHAPEGVTRAHAKVLAMKGARLILSDHPGHPLSEDARQFVEMRGDGLWNAAHRDVQAPVSRAELGIARAVE